MPFAVYSYGKLEIYFQFYLKKPVFDNEDKRLTLLEKLNSIEDINSPKDAIERRPSIELSNLYEKEKREKFCSVFDWYLEEITKA